jgi:hypothetical protein
MALFSASIAPAKNPVADKIYQELTNQAKALGSDKAVVTKGQKSSGR